MPKTGVLKFTQIFGINFALIITMLFKEKLFFTAIPCVLVYLYFRVNPMLLDFCNEIVFV